MLSRKPTAYVSPTLNPFLAPMSTLTVQLPPDLQPDEARLYLSMKLFEVGKLSLGQAAEMAGYSKRTYMELLGRHGIPVIDYAPDEWDDELNV